jgi:hypothetical protein
MKLSVALALALVAGIAGAGTGPAAAQQPATDCNAFLKLRDDAMQKGMAVKSAGQNHADRKQLCSLVQRFAAAEGAAVKFLQDNKTWCGIPDQAITASKASHERTLKFRTVVCTEAPAAQPKAPTLSDALGTPAVDSAKNTRTGRGTFDTLTGNPLSK